MRMTYASFMKFYENVDMSMLWSIWSPWRNKTGATATITKMVPRQHSGPGNSWRYRCKRKCDVSESCKMVGWSRIPGSHGTAAWQTRNVQRPLSDTVQTRASHTTHAFGPRTSTRGYTFEACLFGADRVRSGSSGSQVGEEVVVHVP